MKRKSRRAGTAIFTKPRTLIKIERSGDVRSFEMKPLDIAFFEQVLFRDRHVTLLANGTALYVVRDGGFRIQWRKA